MFLPPNRTHGNYGYCLLSVNKTRYLSEKETIGFEVLPLGMKFPALSEGPHVWWFGSYCIISAVPVFGSTETVKEKMPIKTKLQPQELLQTCTPCSLSRAPGTKGKTLSGIKWQHSLSRYSLFQKLILILLCVLCPNLSPYTTCPLETAAAFSRVNTRSLLWCTRKC